MFSLREQLEKHTGDVLYETLETAKKYDPDTKELVEALLKLMIETISINSLMTSVYLTSGVYNVFTLVKNQVIIKNVICGKMRIDGKSYKVTFSKEKEDIEKGVDFEKHTINFYYVFNIIKNHIKDIGDIKPVIDEEKFSIDFKWKASSDNRTVNRIDTLKRNFTIQNFGDEGDDVFTSEIPFPKGIVDVDVLY